jgi:hypothetical protein
LYSDLGYMRLELGRQDHETVLRAQDVPESLGPLSNTAIVPFFCGELESLLNDLTDAGVRFQSVTRDGDALLLRFTPQV